jgi:dTDP-L-rhamnose 4-epimerase
MMKNILITGGAGFIGSRLALHLTELGYLVRILDNFNPQVHQYKSPPNFLKGIIELISGDIRDRTTFKIALKNIDHVIHFAAETGTGQSMYEIEKYFDVNVQGTAILLDLIQNDSCGKNLQSITIASSRSIYGEGLYTCDQHGKYYPQGRIDTDIKLGFFDFRCPYCSKVLMSLPTPEKSNLNPLSFYAITKLTQEQMILLAAKNLGINGFALRYQNVYGPGQSLKNPYTGILAVFSTLARQNLPLNIFEDGLESRDFVYIDDVIEATARCIGFEGSYIGAINVGSGNAESVISIAQKIRTFYNSQSEIFISGDYRKGDIRHNRADISLLKKLLNVSPKISFDQGIQKFLNWAYQEPIYQIAYNQSIQELKDKNLFIKAKKGLMIK